MSYFSWQELSSESARRWEQLLSHDDQWQAFVEIAKLVQKVRKANALEDYRRIQLELGTQIMSVNRQIGNANTRIAQLYRQLRRLRKANTSLSDQQRVQSQIE